VTGVHRRQPGRQSNGYETTNEKSFLAATLGWPGSVSLRSGQDWADWLQHACGPPPGRPPPAPVRAEAGWTALVHLARRAGFAVERGNCPAGGITTWPDRRIQITPGAAPARAITALAHQLGHVLLHAEIARLERSGTVPCSGLRKVEADSIAFLVATRLGTGAAAITFPHICSWAGTDSRPPRRHHPRGQRPHPGRRCPGHHLPGRRARAQQDRHQGKPHNRRRAQPAQPSDGAARQ